MESKTRVAFYIRVSTDSQVKFGDSMREQHETLKEHLDTMKNAKLIGEYVDGGISGQKINRDEFQHLIDDVKQDKIDLILFTKLDRWFRNLKHYLNTQDILNKHNTAWLAVAQPYFDTSTPQGRAFVNQSMSFAELEAQIDSERIRAVMASKVANGEAVTGRVPIGYSIVDKHLKPNDQAEIAVDVFKYYLKSGSMRKTVYYLEDKYGIIRSYQSVRAMLTNRKYIGEHRGNLNYCPPIVDRETFFTAQKRLANNVKNNAKHEYIFKGLFKCGNCGGSSSATFLNSSYVKKDGTIGKYSRKSYRCSRHRNNSRRCSNKKSVYEATFEKYLLDNIQELITDVYVKAKKAEKKTVANPQVEKDKIARKLNRLKQAYMNEVIDLTEYKKDRQALEDRLSILNVKKNDPTVFKSFETIVSDDFNEFYKKATVAEKNQLWRSIIDKIYFYDDGKIEIIFLE